MFFAYPVSSLAQDFCTGIGGWGDLQPIPLMILYLRPMAAGTVIWTSPSGQTYVTTPGQRAAVPQPVRTHR
jgi:hypothetical protein